MDPGWQYTAPAGFRAAERLLAPRRGFSLRANRALVLALTFLCYAAYHASRKPPSVVKAVLHGAQAGGAGGGGLYGAPPAGGPLSRRAPPAPAPGPAPAPAGAPGWPPFDDPARGLARLGQLDLAFLGAYAVGMFVSGHLGDRADLRHFLTAGMLGSGACVCLFGAGYFWGVHSLRYYVAVQLAGGLLQATGWPSVVSVMANWFGKGKRGLVMGLWNAHTSVGNIAGTVAAAAALRYGWGWSFVVPGVGMLAMGAAVALFLVVEPQDIGFLPQSGSVAGSEAGFGGGDGSGGSTPRSEASTVGGASVASADTRAFLERRLARLAAAGARGSGMVPAHTLAAHHSVHPPRGRHGLWDLGSTLVLAPESSAAAPKPLPGRPSRLGGGGRDGGAPPGYARSGPAGGSPRSERTFRSERNKDALSFAAAWCIPGVAVFALTLFFAKLVAYTFLYWLPYYIESATIGGRTLSPAEAANLSVLFDVGGVAGGAAAGWLSDALGAPALVSSAFVYAAIPLLWAYRAYGGVSFAANVALMTAAGVAVNGPYALITTAVSADLGTHSSLAGSEKALATVTAIIDGMGSVGAALGPLLTGYISALPGGFDNVFAMLCLAAAAAGLLLSGLVLREVGEMAGRRGRGGGQPPLPAVPEGLEGVALLGREAAELDGGRLAAALPPGAPA